MERGKCIECQGIRRIFCSRTSQKTAKEPQFQKTALHVYSASFRHFLTAATFISDIFPDCKNFSTLGNSVTTMLSYEIYIIETNPEGARR